MRKVTSSTFKTPIGVAYGIGVDYDEDTKNIRWFWPYVTIKDETCAYPLGSYILKSLGVELGYNTPIDQIDFIIPIEYKKKSREDVSRFYKTFGNLYDLATKEEIFYRVHRKDGSIGVESNSPHNFFINFKPEVKE